MTVETVTKLTKLRGSVLQRSIDATGQLLPPVGADDQTACAHYVRQPPELQGNFCRH